MKKLRSWFGAGAIALLAPALVAMAGDSYGVPEAEYERLFSVT